MKQLLLVAAMVFLVQSSFASDSYILKLKDGVNPVLFSAQNNVTLKQLVPGMNLYKATPKSSELNVAAVRSQKAVDFVQPNHKVTPRGDLTPNDKDFSNQWGFIFDNSTTFGINAPAAWSVYGTGGLDVAGNEIVIAVVDGGFDVTHPDLVNNNWVNKGEIAGNNIDDDGNGYIDDINGWDVDSETGTIQVDYHGTHVAGTMGAEGNNGINGSGVNWKIKIMYVSAGWQLADTAYTMSAYGYILKQKELWIQSGGKEGANVVAINSSFGIDRADCSSGEYATWNEMFDKLGEAGILSVAATANADWNIDEVGDVPTGCKSEYVVAVTNSEKNGERTHDAGYGKTAVDLAAPGTDILSTFPNKDFGSNTGTSMATPHVTGSVGFLYSAASQSFIEDAMVNPGAAALKIKDIMLKTVTTRSSMNGQSVSGGILNLFAASQEAADYVRQIPMLPGAMASAEGGTSSAPATR